MNQSTKYYEFSGEITNENFAKSLHYSEDKIINSINSKMGEHTVYIVEKLNQNIYQIEKEIKHKISHSLPSVVEIQINMHFKRGSILWFGAIEFLNEAIQVMATAGGAISFIKIIRDAIDSVIEKYIHRINSNINTKQLNIYTEINFISSSSSCIAEEKTFLYDIDQALLNSNIYKIGKWLIGLLVTLILIAIFGGTFYTSQQISSLTELANNSKLEITRVTETTVSSIENKLKDFEKFIKEKNLDNAKQKYETMLKDVQEHSIQAKEKITVLVKKSENDFTNAKNEVLKSSEDPTTYILGEKKLVQSQVIKVQNVLSDATIKIRGIEQASKQKLDVSEISDINNTKLELKEIQIQMKFIQNNLYKFYALLISLTLLIFFLAIWVLKLKRDNKNLQ